MIEKFISSKPFACKLPSQIVGNNELRQTEKIKGRMTKVTGKAKGCTIFHL
jgi:hypothetical protein